MTVDVHQHLWPASFVEALRARTTAPFLEGDSLVLGEGRFPHDPAEHDLHQRLAALDQDGIDVAVVSLQPSLGLDALQPLERRSLEDAWLAGIHQLAQESHGRLVPLAPGRVVEGCAGTSLAAELLDDLDAVAPLLDEVSQDGGFLFVHPGTARLRPGTPRWWAGIVDYAAVMQAAWFSWLDQGRERWPELRLVFAMLAGGAPFHLERLALRSALDVRSMLDPNVYLDVSTHGRRAIELCIETFGVEQLVYGSDAPVVDPAPTLRAVRGFGDSVAHIILHDNPEKLLR